jgi:hypothetical protein
MKRLPTRRHFKELADVLARRTSLNAYLARNFPSLFRMEPSKIILKGAKETIRRFKPKMAIAAYHLPDDKKVIPELVLSIRDDYKFKFVNKGEEDLFFF